LYKTAIAIAFVISLMEDRVLYLFLCEKELKTRAGEDARRAYANVCADTR
jgi:hypothetical protein